MCRIMTPLLATMVWVTAAQTQERYQFETYTLDNGLNVVLSEDHSSAVVAINIWYDVGSRNERPGRSGFAHLFEHMMFQGSANVDKGEHMQLLERAGSSFNGTTNEDRTAYFETVPANRFNLGLWLEADRMQSLVITDENFENQRETVKEERRLGVDNQPYGRAFTDGFTLPYDSTKCFAYAHTVIGSMDDLNDAKTEDVQAFFDLYYAPNNAVLTIVGDFQPDVAKLLIQQYFGDIPRNEAPPPVSCEHTYNAGPMRATYEDQLANLPAVLVFYRIPPHQDSASYALQLLSTALGQGESSRLNRTMVRESGVALQAGAGMNSRRGPSLFLAFAIANQGVTVDSLERQLHREVARVVADGIAADELEKAKNAVRSGQIFGRQTAMGLANSLLHYAFYHESIDRINGDLDRYLSWTPQGVRRAAAQYLIPENSYTVVVVPKAASDQDGGAQ